MNIYLRAARCYLNRLVVAAIVVPSVIACGLAMATGDFGFDGVAHAYVQSIVEMGTGTADAVKISWCADPTKTLDGHPRPPSPECAHTASKIISASAYEQTLSHGLTYAYSLFVVMGICVAFIFAGESPLRLRTRAEESISRYASSLWPARDGQK